MTPRDREIASAIASGSTAPAVAAEYGITPARVRQIAAAAGVAPRRAGRPVSTGRGEARVQVRLSAEERAALAVLAGSPARVAAYLRGAGLALPGIATVLESAGDTLTDGEAVRLALADARRVVGRGRRENHRGSGRQP